MPCSITRVGRRARVPEERVEVGDVDERRGRRGRPSGGACRRSGPAARCARRRSRGASPGGTQVELVRALVDDDVEVLLARAARAGARSRCPASRRSARCRARRRRGRAARARRTRGGPGRTPSSTRRARARAGSSCRHRPPGRGARRRRARRSTGTPFRHGCPTTGQVRARQPAHSTSTYSSSCGTAPRAPAHGRDGRREERDDRRPDRRREVRRAGVADDDRVGAFDHPRQLGQRRPSAEVESRVAGDERGQLALARPAGDHDVVPARRAAPATSSALRSGSHARAGTLGPGMHDHVGAQLAESGLRAFDAQAVVARVAGSRRRW